MRGISVDLTNKRFGKLVAIKKTNKRKFLSSLWLCKCDCGRKILIAANQLVRIKNTSCGCNAKINNSVGKKFNRLLILRRDPNDIRRVICKCDCGTIKSIRFCAVLKGTQSCGCLFKELARTIHTTHGMTKTKVYQCWVGMLVRCYKKRALSYKHYGLRGIKVCKQWHKFENFYADMGMPPTTQHSIDRINVNGDYKPSNCRWATSKEQANNATKNRRISFNRRTLTLTQWSEELNISRFALQKRLDKYKWSIHRAFTTPVKHLTSGKNANVQSSNYK